MIKLAVEHATQRKQFKTRIADFEMIREKIAEMTAHTYVLESMVYMTAGLVDKKVDYSMEGACCKVWGTELLWKTINEALQIAGGDVEALAGRGGPLDHRQDRVGHVVVVGR